MATETGSFSKATAPFSRKPWSPTPTPSNFRPQPPVNLRLRPPPPRPRSLTRSPPPMTAAKFPLSPRTWRTQAESRGNVEKEISCDLPGFRRPPAATFTARSRAHFREGVLLLRRRRATMTFGTLSRSAGVAPRAVSWFGAQISRRPRSRFGLLCGRLTRFRESCVETAPGHLQGAPPRRPVAMAACQDVHPAPHRLHPASRREAPLLFWLVRLPRHARPHTGRLETHSTPALLPDLRAGSTP